MGQGIICQRPVHLYRDGGPLGAELFTYVKEHSIGARRELKPHSVTWQPPRCLAGRAGAHIVEVAHAGDECMTSDGDYSCNPESCRSHSMGIASWRTLHAGCRSESSALVSYFLSHFILKTKNSFCQNSNQPSLICYWESWVAVNMAAIKPLTMEITQLSHDPQQKVSLVRQCYIHSPSHGIPHNMPLLLPFRLSPNFSRLLNGKFVQLCNNTSPTYPYLCFWPFEKPR